MLVQLYRTTSVIVFRDLTGTLFYGTISMLVLVIIFHVLILEQWAKLQLLFNL
jgi:hypothetical protein